MHKHIFREYDIRGKVGTELVVSEVYPLMRAVAAYFLQEKPSTKKVVVGFDGRTHSVAIKEEVCRALQESGLDVVCIGLCPTPVLYFALHTLPVDAGIMITASHNGPEYNGFKINLGTNSVWGKEIQVVRALYEARVQHHAEIIGTYTDYPITDAYIAWLVRHFSHLQGLALPVVFDCANGAVGAVLPQLVKALGWKNAHILYPEVDGTFPHHEADPIVEENANDLRVAIAEQAAAYGIGFDGDGDRMAPVTGSGKLVAGDQLLVLYARDIVAHNQDASIVYDIKCSQIVAQLVTQAGGKAYVSPSGHSIIKTGLRKHKALLAGELSCHFFFADRYFGYDDGIYAALRLIELVQRSQCTLDEMVAALPTTYTMPELRFSCAEEDKPLLVAAARSYFSEKEFCEMTLLDGMRVDMGYGWGLIRASNTQPVICIRCESDSPEGLRTIKHDFVQALSNQIDVRLLTQALGGE